MMKLIFKKKKKTTLYSENCWNAFSKNNKLSPMISSKNKQEYITRWNLAQRDEIHQSQESKIPYYDT